MKRLEKTWVKIFLSSMALVLLSFLFFGFSYAGDPGIPDTVRFESWGTYIPCPPCSGRGVIPLVVVNDERLAHFVIPLHWFGPLTCDTVEFIGRVQSLRLTSHIYLEDESILLMGITFDADSIMPPGDGIIAYLHFSLQDTGMAGIDLANFPIPEYYLSFSDSTFNPFIPEFVESEHHVVPQDKVPGDVNQNGGVDLADIVFFINYLFKNGPAPAYPPCADPNIDCCVSLADVVYLINYVFKNGPEPRIGCAY